jgi:hypothetical protein
MPAPPQSVHLWLAFVTAIQTLLLLGALICACTSERTYPAMRGYLLLNTIAGALICLLHGLPAVQGMPSDRSAELYATLFWTAYGASGILTFLTVQQIFRDALNPLPGLRRLALVAFRWVAVISVALSVVPAIVPLFFRAHSLQTAVLQSTRCVSVIEFCLLAFILLAAQALGITYRSRIVGITLGFGVLAVVDTVCFLFLLRSGSLLPWLLVRQIGATVAASIWLVYLVMPEPVRIPVMLRSQSQLQRWNEIAVALGKPAPNVAFGQPEPTAFFLRDVENVVDRVLSRNGPQPPASS